ncbi:HU family DNA-binding protein [Candidatus Poribacteria bacterium]|nr:HU family DNA-binding protein [Candidatus Poribacteria bacterium]
MADVTKADVVNSVAEATGLSKRDAGAALDAVIGTIKDSLAGGKSVGLIGFGTFEVKTRAAREGRNPQTGAKIQIPEKKVPAFKAGKGLREAVA